MNRYRRLLIIASVAVLNAAAWGIALATSPAHLPPIRVAAEFLSTSALIIMSTNLLLATRARPFEDLFGGLDKLFATHRLDGLTAGSVITLHFLLMPKSVGWVPSKLIGYPAIAIIVFSVLMAVAPRAPWRRLVPLNYQTWKLGHRFMGVFVAAGVTHSVVAHPLVMGLVVPRTLVYGVAALGLAAYAYRETVERFVKERHVYRVGTPEHIADDVLEIPLEPVREPIAYSPGQFAFVRFEGGPSREQHPFTISSHPSTGGLRFSVKASGDYTRDLQSCLDSGSLARIEGPYGRFDYRRGGRRQLWLAGGIGITPFLPFVADVGPEFDVRLVWTVHDEAEAVYRAEIAEALAGRPHVAFSVHAASAAGRLHVADLGLGRPAELSVFLCGPVPMRDAFVAQLLELRVARAAIHYEEFSLR